MNDRQYVIRAAQMQGLSLMKPKKGVPGILAYDYNNKDARGLFPCVINATSWALAESAFGFYAQVNGELMYSLNYRKVLAAIARSK